MAWLTVRRGFCICHRGRILDGGRLLEVTEAEAAGLVHATEAASPGWLRRVAHRAMRSAAGRIDAWREARKRSRRRRPTTRRTKAR